MGSHGIKDQVAIIGMGCTPFTEHWDKSLDDLIIDAAQLTYASAASTRTTSMRSGSAPRSPQPRVSPWAAR